MKIIIIYLILALFIPNGSLHGSPDDIIYSNKAYYSNIKTVQLYKEGWNLSYPFIKLRSPEKLILNFDLVEDQAKTYYYTIIHCDKDWKQSDIFPYDYIDGYSDNPIEDYEASFNTTVNYYHYTLTFPNDRINLKLSGNYILIVYPFNTPEKPVLTQRFIVAEDAVNINVTAHRPLMTRDNNTHQQIDFNVNLNASGIIDPFRNVFATILQNGRWDNSIMNLKPDFYGDNVLKYNSLSDKNIFPGGNEFRYFDIKSIRYQTEYVKNIDFAVTNYNIYLYPSENREFKPYFYWQDFNGNYYIAIQEGQKPEIDADYVNVYFTLPSKRVIPNGNMYISGNFNNWNFDKTNLMFYNQERGEYECTLLLKQGWYNYEYVFLKEGSTNGTTSFFEGNHYETENDYIVIIYYRNPRDRYDRVMGTVTANTLNKLAN